MTNCSQLQSLIAKFVSKGHTYECARLIVRYFVNSHDKQSIQVSKKNQFNSSKRKLP